MSNAAQTWIIIGAVAALVAVITGLQCYWIGLRFDRINKQLDRIEDMFAMVDEVIASTAFPDLPRPVHDELAPPDPRDSPYHNPPG